MELLNQNFIPKTIKTRMIFFIVADILLISSSVYLAFLLRFEGKIPSQYSTDALQGMIILALVSCVPAFYVFKLYFFSWTYVSTQELVSLLKSVIFGFLLSGAAILVFSGLPQFSGFPRSILFISYFLIFIFCGGIRFSKRIYIHMRQNKPKGEKKRTLIVGAGDAGEQILRSIMSSRISHYMPVGFADEYKSKQGSLIHGVKVLGRIDDIPEIISDYRIEEMIIAMPSASSNVIKKSVELGRKSNLKNIKIAPSITDIINEEVSLSVLRDVSVEDLLGRDTVSLDKTIIENFIRDKVVLITGGAGSIGSELCRQVAKFNPCLLIVLDQDETGIFNISKTLKNQFPGLKVLSMVNDICDKPKIEQIFEKFRPNIIFHAAAYKHVPLMEAHPDEAAKNNIFGTKVVAESALKFGSEKFVFISTDKAINPSSVMGATKRIGEMLCQVFNQKNHTKFISVRFGNVLDSRGSVIPIFREQIKKGGPVEITHPDMKRYFMVTSEACLLVMQAGAMGAGGEVFVLDMGEPIKILDLAKEMIRLSGFEPDLDIPIVFTGIRPGEKFFEEILTAEEGTIATKNQKIFTAKLAKINEQDIDGKLKELENIVKRLNEEEIIGLLKKIVPTYNH